ncbi:hypothetical protein ACYOEI_09270 [Singulisphaera rosea]
MTTFLLSIVTGGAWWAMPTLRDDFGTDRHGEWLRKERRWGLKG